MRHQILAKILNKQENISQYLTLLSDLDIENLKSEIDKQINDYREQIQQTLTQSLEIKKALANSLIELLNNQQLYELGEIKKEYIVQFESTLKELLVERIMAKINLKYTSTDKVKVELYFCSLKKLIGIVLPNKPVQVQANEKEVDEAPRIATLLERVPC